MSAPQCPICGKPPHSDYRPFCSRRCSDVDLQRWLAGRYAIPGSSENGASEEPPED